jgi:hypothetical protein
MLSAHLYLRTGTMPLRYDNPKATSRKRLVYLAFQRGGAAEALDIAADLDIERTTCARWVSEFYHRDAKAAARRARANYLNPASTSIKREMYLAFLQGGPSAVVLIGRKRNVSVATISRYIKSFLDANRIRVPMGRRVVSWKEVEQVRAALLEVGQPPALARC